MSFENDEPIDLDCGCAAHPGDDYYELQVPVWNIAKSKFEIKILTYCGEYDCLFKVLDGRIRIDTMHVNTAYENEQEYDDYRADEEDF